MRRFISECVQFRVDLKHAAGLFVFDRNIAIDIGQELKVQLVCAILYPNIAVEAGSPGSVLNRNGTELIACALQVHTTEAVGNYALRLDARRRILKDSAVVHIRACGGQRYHLARRKNRIRCLRQVAQRPQGKIFRSGEIAVIGHGTALPQILYRDIPCHLTINRNGQRIGIVLYAHIPGNICIAATVNDNAVELIGRIFQ